MMGGIVLGRKGAWGSGRFIEVDHAGTRNGEGLDGKGPAPQVPTLQTLIQEKG